MASIVRDQAAGATVVRAFSLAPCHSLSKWSWHEPSLRWQLLPGDQV